MYFVAFHLQSREDVIKMVSHLAKVARKYGRTFNYEKTKLLDVHGISTNAATVLIDGTAVDVLGPLQSEKYLGRKICCGSYHETEIQNRIAAGWASFMKYKKELCSKHGSFRLKAKLFESVVTTRVMYGCAAWTLTDVLEKRWRFLSKNGAIQAFSYRQR